MLLEKYWWFQISFGKKCKLRLCSFEIILCNLIHTFQYENSQGKLSLPLLPTTKGQWVFYWLLCLVGIPFWWDWFCSLFNLKKVFLISLFLRIFLVCHNLLLLSPLYKMLSWFSYSNAFSILFIFLSYWQLSVLWQVAFMIIHSQIVWKKRKASDLCPEFKRLNFILL